MLVLSEWVKEQPKQRVQNIASRGVRLPLSEIYWTLDKMGSVMSLHKVHRKIALTYTVLKEMEIGQALPAEEITVMTTKYVRQGSSNLNPRTVSHLMRCLKKWGLVESIPAKTSGPFKGLQLYRRVA